MPYLDKLLANAHNLPRGRVTITEIQHDEWCPMLNGGNECKCEPNIVSRQVAAPAAKRDDGT